MRTPLVHLFSRSALALTLSATSAHAQVALRVGGASASSGVRDFRPVAVGQEAFWPFTASGALSTPQMFGLGCYSGYVSQRPDVILRVRTPVSALRVWVANPRVVSTAGTAPPTGATIADPGLVVNSADGRWHCDERTMAGAAPQVVLTNVGVGQYDIWVGSRRHGDVLSGELHVASIPFVETGGRIATQGVHELSSESSPPLELTVAERTPGDIDIRAVSNQCSGTVPPVPDAIVRLSAPLPQLRAWAVTTEDTSIVVHTPDDRWRCATTIGGRPPQALLRDVPAGQYELWVGARFPRPVRGTLHVSVAPLLELGGTSATLGVVPLSPTFTPDPTELTLSERPVGDVDARLASLGCTGRVPSRPDVIVRLDAPIPSLRAFFTSTTDTSLVVHGPEDLWRCSDSGYSRLDPLVDLVNPTPGQYEIWVGSPGAAQTVAGTLHFARSPLVEIGGAAGALATQQLPAGFEGDSWSVPIPTRAAGELSARVAATNCVGQISRRPDLVLTLDSALPLLRAYIDAPVDTTLLVHGPGDTWRCNDDSNAGGRNINPMVDFANAAPGRYEVWAGAFPGVASYSGTLHVTRSAQRQPPAIANPIEAPAATPPAPTAPTAPSPPPAPPAASAPPPHAPAIAAPPARPRAAPRRTR